MYMNHVCSQCYNICMISYLLENNSCTDYDYAKSINRKFWNWLPHPIPDDRKNAIIFSVFRKKVIDKNLVQCIIVVLFKRGKSWYLKEENNISGKEGNMIQKVIRTHNNKSKHKKEALHIKAISKLERRPRSPKWFHVSSNLHIKQILFMLENVE